MVKKVLIGCGVALAGFAALRMLASVVSAPQTKPAASVPPPLANQSPPSPLLPADAWTQPMLEAVMVDVPGFTKKGVSSWTAAGIGADATYTSSDGVPVLVTVRWERGVSAISLEDAKPTGIDVNTHEAVVCGFGNIGPTKLLGCSSYGAYRTTLQWNVNDAMFTVGIPNPSKLPMKRAQELVNAVAGVLVPASAAPTLEAARNAALRFERDAGDLAVNAIQREARTRWGFISDVDKDPEMKRAIVVVVNAAWFGMTREQKMQAVHEVEATSSKYAPKYNLWFWDSHGNVLARKQLLGGGMMLVDP